MASEAINIVRMAVETNNFLEFEFYFVKMAAECFVDGRLMT